MLLKEAAMVRNLRRGLTFLVLFTTIGAAVTHAADLDKATIEAEGRKRAAENGARTIRSKSPQQAEQVRTIYDEAAAAHNAWLDATKNAIDKGESDSGVTESANKAASSLVRWVAARNQALGEPVLAGKVAETVEGSARQGLIDISSETARKQRRADATKKTQAVTELTNRLRWKMWSEI
jgi:hypothetical protein